MIFCVLCVSVFAVLTLSTAMNEKRLSDLAAQRAAEYYEADCRAAEIVSDLAAGKEPPGDVEISRTDSDEGQIVEFSLPAGGERLLMVRAALDGNGGCRVLCWKTGYAGDWETNETIEIWDGA